LNGGISEARWSGSWVLVFVRKKITIALLSGRRQGKRAVRRIWLLQIDCFTVASGY